MRELKFTYLANGTVIPSRLRDPRRTSHPCSSVAGCPAGSDLERDSAPMTTRTSTVMVLSRALGTTACRANVAVSFFAQWEQLKRTLGSISPRTDCRCDHGRCYMIHQIRSLPQPICTTSPFIQLAHDKPVPGQRNAAPALKRS